MRIVAPWPSSTSIMHWRDEGGISRGRSSTNAARAFFGSEVSEEAASRCFLSDSYFRPNAPAVLLIPCAGETSQPSARGPQAGGSVAAAGFASDRTGDVRYARRPGRGVDGRIFIGRSPTRGFAGSADAPFHRPPIRPNPPAPTENTQPQQIISCTLAESTR